MNWSFWYPIYGRRIHYKLFCFSYLFIQQCAILQIVSPGKILKLRVRGIKQDLTQDTSSEEVCVVMPGVVARFEGTDIKVF